MFVRSYQLDQLKECNDNQCVKVITGVRRCGKTILLRQVKDSLRRRGVANSQIHFFNFSQFYRQQLVDWPVLAASISKKLIAKKMNYLFLDELDQFDHALPLLQAIIKHCNVSLYVTAAAQSFLTQLAPLQSRLVVIPVLPLGFAEFCQHHHQPANQHTLYQYLNVGGFPFAQGFRDQLTRENYLDGVFNTTLVNGFTKHGTLCNPFLTKQLAIFVAGQLGLPINASRAVSGLKAVGVPASSKTLNTYLALLADTYLFYPCHELDLAANRIKPTNAKYYPVDPGLRNYLTNQKGVLSQSNLEALLFIELVRRGYSVYSSKRFTFVADRHQQRTYIQFSYSIRNQREYDRATASLRTLPTNCQKQLIVLRAADILSQDPTVPMTLLTDWLTSSQSA
ncbi:MAG: ATP-binding protein [Limosilactobacillus sp.]